MKLDGCFYELFFCASHDDSASSLQEVGEELKQRGTEVRGVVGAWSGGEERGRKKKARGAEALERRWHRLILQALEAQFRLEAALRNAQQVSRCLLDLLLCSQ